MSCKNCGPKEDKKMIIDNFFINVIIKLISVILIIISLPIIYIILPFFMFYTIFNGTPNANILLDLVNGIGKNKKIKNNKNSNTDFDNLEVIEI
jgi:hypothetical protein